MHIVILIYGQEVVRQEIPDEYLVDIAGYSSAENLEAREKIIDLHLQQIRELDKKRFSKQDIEYALLFQSKMNKWDEVAIDEILKDTEVA
jgi:hypothetical protein